MFVGITNTPQPYAWGSSSAIAQLLGREPSGGPEAELWLGTHLGSPSLLADGSGTLADRLTTEGEPALPFLLKVLAAESALSLQAHPTPEQARAGFERENALGIPIDAPHRNYRDPFAKPELIVAVSESFRALCGFRPVAQSRADVERLIDAGARDEVPALLAQLTTDADLRGVFERLSSRGPGVDELVAEVSAAAAAVDGFRTTRELAAEYPGDPGIVLSLLLHDVELAAGEALYLPAGNIHAYLSGVGIELMTASDNVLRGGLTPKHVDVDELLAVLDFAPGPVPYLSPSQPAAGITEWAPPAGFRLLRLAGGTDLALRGPAVALALQGPGELGGAGGAWRFERGDAAYVSPDERLLRLDAGELWIATV